MWMCVCLSLSLSQTHTVTLHSPEVSWRSISRWHFVRGWVWHLGCVAVIGFVLCCRSDQGKIDREALQMCVRVCVSVCVLYRLRAWTHEKGWTVCIPGKEEAWKGRVRRWSARCWHHKVWLWHHRSDTWDPRTHSPSRRLLSIIKYNCTNHPLCGCVTLAWLLRFHALLPLYWRHTTALRCAFPSSQFTIWLCCLCIAIVLLPSVRPISVECLNHSKLYSLSWMTT